MSEASSDYNKAVASILNSDAILRDNISRATNISRDFLSRQATYEAILKKLEYAKDKMRLLQENYKQGTVALGYAKDNLSFANEAFPVGDKRFEFADKLYKQGLEIVTKNPGKNYEDKRYFDGIWTSYVRAKAQFQAKQKEASKLVLTLSIANPRMEGIETTLKLAQDFLDKTSKSVDENKEITDEMREKVQNLYDESIKAYEDLTAQMQKLAEARSKFTKANFALSVFIMNELPKNEKYYETIFSADVQYLNALNGGMLYPTTWGDTQSSVGGSYTRNATMDQMATVGGAYEMAMPPSISLAAELSAGASLKSRSTVGQSIGSRGLTSDVLNFPSKPENLREEVFNISLQLSNLAAEIAQANALLGDIVAESQASLSAVETSEADANTLLRSVMGFFTEAQSNYSELQIFKNSAAVTISQSKVSSNEFKKLCESADKDIKACSENTSKSSDKLTAAKAALK
jgi:uncharacterized protein Yka (UPF0111/DUF47 family)